MRSSTFTQARRYSIAIFTTSRRLDSTSWRAASTSPLSTQRRASVCSSSREIGA
jgi:type IV secretory pathway VirB3-like protein